MMVLSIDKMKVSQYYNTIKVQSYRMDKLRVIKHKPKKHKIDSPPVQMSDKSQQTQEGQAEKLQERSCEMPKLNQANEPQADDYDSKSDICTAETSERWMNQSKYSFINPIRPSKSLPYICGLCNKQFVKRRTLTRHLRQKHSFQLTNELYLIVRKRLAQDDHYTSQDYFSQHKELIKKIQIGEIQSFPIPEQLKNRLNRQFANQVKQKYLDFNVLFKKSQIKFYTMPRSYENNMCRKCQMSSEFMTSFKKLTLKYVVEFQRQFEMFIKNITISELLVLFLFNFSYNIPRFQSTLFSFQMMQFFCSVMSHFEKWVNKNNESVFKLHKLFYYETGADNEPYCERQRTWRIDILIRDYLKEMKKKIESISELKLANLIILCFHEYLGLEKLQV